MADAPGKSVIDANDPRIEQGHRRLDAFWNAIGPSDPDFISYAVNPMFQGKPAWPNTRQAYRLVRPHRSLIIASDGLSDPFVGTERDDRQGFGCEVFVEAPEFAVADFARIRACWAFRVIEEFAMNVADWGGISERLAKLDVLSVEFAMQDVLPPSMLTDDGTAGFLINLKPPRRESRLTDMPFGPVDIVCLTLIAPMDLEAVRSGGAAARQVLAAARNHKPNGHCSRVS